MARGRGKLTPQDYDDMRTISENINKFLKNGNYKQVDLVRATGIPASTLTGYVKGTSLPVPGNVQKIADFFGVLKSEIDPRFKTSVTIPHHQEEPSTLQQITDTSSQLDHERQLYVLDTAEKQLQEQNTVQEEPAEYSSDKVVSIKKKLFKYHVYEKLSAGTGESYFNDWNYDEVYYDEEIDHDFASWIFGDSMEPRFLNGEVALIKDTGFDYDGAIYAVEWDGQTYIKKVKREKDGLRLISLNSKYKDKFAPYDEDPRIIGKIVGSFQPISI